MGRGGQYEVVVCDDTGCGARFRISASRVAEASARDGLWCPCCRGSASPPAAEVEDGEEPVTEAQRASIASIVARVVREGDVAGEAALKRHTESRAPLKRAGVPFGARRTA